MRPCKVPPTQHLKSSLNNQMFYNGSVYILEQIEIRLHRLLKFYEHISITMLTTNAHAAHLRPLGLTTPNRNHSDETLCCDDTIFPPGFDSLSLCRVRKQRLILTIV